MTAQLKREIRNFRKKREKSQYEKIKLMLQEQPALEKAIKHNKFIMDVISKKGVNNDKNMINKVNSQIIRLEEIFESRKNLKIQRPDHKDKVLGDLKKDRLSHPQFISRLKTEQKEMDKFLKMHKQLTKNNMQKLEMEVISSDQETERMESPPLRRSQRIRESNKEIMIISQSIDQENMFNEGISQLALPSKKSQPKSKKLHESNNKSLQQGNTQASEVPSTSQV